MTKEEKLQKIKQGVGVTMADIPRNQMQLEVGIMIGDVLSWMTNLEGGRTYEKVGEIVSSRKKRKESLDKQDDSCVDFIFELVSNT